MKNGVDDLGKTQNLASRKVDQDVRGTRRGHKYNDCFNETKYNARLG